MSLSPATVLHLFDETLHASAQADTDDQNGWFLPSSRPVERLGLALGHRRCERWGLRTLARLLREHPEGKNLKSLVAAA